MRKSASNRTSVHSRHLRATATIGTRVEPLEARRMLSLGSAIIASLYEAAGNSWQYQQLVSGAGNGQVAYRSLGSQSSGGVSGFELDTTTTLTGGAYSVVVADKDFFANASTGMVDNGNSELSSINNLETAVTTRQFSPVELFLPAMMVAGQTYSSTFTETITTAPPGEASTTTTESVAEQFMLVSDSTQPMTVPAGTYNTYEVDQTTTLTPQGGAATTTTQENYFAMGTGLIEQVSGPLVNPSSTLVLQTADVVATVPVTVNVGGTTGGTTGGGGMGGNVGSGPTAPPAALTPAIAGRLPTSTLLAGQKTSLAPSIQLTDTSGSPYDAPATVKLFLAAGMSVDSSSISLPAGLSRTFKLKNKQQMSFKLHLSSLPASMPDGTYHLLVQVTDKSGNSSVAASSGMIMVAGAQIELAGAFAKPVAPDAHGQTPLTFTVSNRGNVPADGQLAFNIDRSPDGQVSDASVITTLHKPITIKPGKSTRITSVVSLPVGTYFLVIQLDPADSFKNPNLANNIFATTTQITAS